MGAKDYPEELVWDQNSKRIRHLLCKLPRLKINDRIVLGNKINEIKSTNGFNLVGQNIWIAPKWNDGFWEDLSHEAR